MKRVVIGSKVVIPAWTNYEPFGLIMGYYCLITIARKGPSGRSKESV